MNTHSLRLVTIIAEPVLEARITHDLQQLGATGWTVVDGRGQGARGLHTGEIPGVNVRIESIVSADVADGIAAYLALHYFIDFSVIAYVSEVAVVRGDKYLPRTDEVR